MLRYTYEFTRLMASTARHNFYQLSALKLGAEVIGISLQEDVPQQVIDQIRRDVHTNCILVFRNQGVISGKRQVEISRWFGELDSTFYRHPRSPDPDVFRVSNDSNEGCTQVGRTGWHIDGSFQPAPFAYSIYHIVSVPDKGNTGKNACKVLDPVHPLMSSTRFRVLCNYYSYKSNLHKSSF